MVGFRVVAAFTLAACDTSDSFAIRDDATAALAVTVTPTKVMTAYDCADGSAPKQSIEPQLLNTLTIAVGRRVCFEGPTRGSDYNALEFVTLLSIARDGDSTPCISGDGRSMEADFVTEGYVDTLAVTDATCP